MQSGVRPDDGNDRDGACPSKQAYRIGRCNTKGTGVDSITVGNGAQSTSKDNIAIGRDAQAGFGAPAGSALETDKPDTDLRAIAIGAGTKALEQDTIAIGFGALAEDKMTGAVALGA